MGTALPLATVDGARVEVSVPFGTPSFTGSSVTVKGKLLTTFLDAAHASHADEVASNESICTDFKITDEVSVPGGRIWSGMGVPPAEPSGDYWYQLEDGTWERERFVLAAWVGQAHSVHAHRYQGTSEELLGFLVSLAFLESEYGVTCHLPGPEVQFGTDPSARIWLTEVGIVEVSPLGSDEAPPVPRQEGESVAGGQLYRSDGLDHATFAIVGQDVSLALSPLTDDAGLVGSWLEEVEFSWVRAGS